MASVEDRWFRPVRNPETGKIVFDDRDKPVLEKTARHAKGLRWLARWREPDGQPRKRSFARKGDADAHITTVEADKLRGTYIDARLGQELFGVFASRWLQTQTTDVLTRQGIRDRLRAYVEPYPLWRTPLNTKPGGVQAWVKTLDGLGLAKSTQALVFGHVFAVFNAAVAEELIVKNPCKSPNVRAPKPDPSKITPWTGAQVHALHDAMPQRYRVLVPLGSGCGLRQGELFGLSPDDAEFLRGWLHVRRQVKIVGGVLVYALPKGRKTRDVPLPSTVKDELAAHLAAYPAQPVTLPWGEPGGKPTTVSLAVSPAVGEALNRNTFNRAVWRPSLVKAGIAPGRENGCHALRHYYASVLLSGGESIKALSEYLGHGSAAFTLKTYTHLMPESETRTRTAIDSAWRAPSGAPEAQKGALTSGSS